MTKDADGLLVNLIPLLGKRSKNENQRGGLVGPSASSVTYNGVLERKLVPSNLAATRSPPGMFSFRRGSPVVPISSLPVASWKAATTDLVTPIPYRSAFDPFIKRDCIAKPTVSVPPVASCSQPQGNLATTTLDGLSLQKDAVPDDYTLQSQVQIVQCGRALFPGSSCKKTPMIKSPQDFSIVVSHRRLTSSDTLQSNISDIDEASVLKIVHQKTASSSEPDKTYPSAIEINDVQSILSDETLLSVPADAHLSTSEPPTADVPSLFNEELSSKGSSTRNGDAEVYETNRRDARLRRRDLLLQILNHGDDNASALTTSTFSSTGCVSPATVREGAYMTLDRCFASSIAELLTGVEVHISSTPMNFSPPRDVVSRMMPLRPSARRACLAVTNGTTSTSSSFGRTETKMIDKATPTQNVGALK